MTVPPRQALLEDPRFERVCTKAMGKHGLMPFARPKIEKFVSGELDVGSLQCCHSGCTPCVQQFTGCVDQIVTTLQRRKRRFLFF